MKIIKLYTGTNQKSYFEETDSDSSIKQALGYYSETKPVTGLIFRDFVSGEIFDWHNAPRVQYIVYLEGQIEVEASGGDKKIFKAGDILLAADLTGKGHITRTLTNGKSVIIIC